MGSHLASQHGIHAHPLEWRARDGEEVFGVHHRAAPSALRALEGDVSQVEHRRQQAPGVVQFNVRETEEAQRLQQPAIRPPRPVTFSVDCNRAKHPDRVSTPSSETQRNDRTGTSTNDDAKLTQAVCHAPLELVAIRHVVLPHESLFGLPPEVPEILGGAQAEAVSEGGVRLRGGQQLVEDVEVAVALGEADHAGAFQQVGVDCGVCDLAIRREAHLRGHAALALSQREQ
eukprot:155723-Pyramimonas_sp.AAC.2